jgi:hypothetical protein
MASSGELERSAVAVKPGGRHREIRPRDPKIPDHEVIQMPQDRSEHRTASISAIVSE